MFWYLRWLARFAVLTVSKPTKRLRSPELNCFLQETRALQGRLDGPRCLPKPPHPTHAVEQGRGEFRVSEQVVIEKVKVASRQPVDLRERVVDDLCVELFSALEECCYKVAQQRSSGVMKS